MKFAKTARSHHIVQHGGPYSAEYSAKILDFSSNVNPLGFPAVVKKALDLAKILGKLKDGKIEPANIKVSCTCTRVPVIDGHTESVFVETSKPAKADDVKHSIEEFSNHISVTGLPSAPKDYLVVHQDPTRPQPRIDRQINDGMTTSMGRLEEDQIFDNGLKYVLFSHNKKMGSAKGAVLLAEMLYKKGKI